MDRTTAFLAQVPLVEKDFLLPQRNSMVGIAKLSEAVLGPTSTVDGLLVNPTAPVSLAVRVDPGQIYALTALDATAYGSLAADTQHLVVKQGVLMDPLTLAVSPPGTAGFAQWFLVQVAFQEQDAGATVLPYYNSANPAVAFAGPNNTGEQQYTERRGRAVIQLKAGAPAPNGAHLRPAADPGWVGLAWVNAINGNPAIRQEHIVPVPDAPRTRVKLPQMERAIGLTYSIVRQSMQLTPEMSGVVLVDTSATGGVIELKLPPAGSIPRVCLRFTIVARDLNPTAVRSTRPGVRIVPGPGDFMEYASAFIQTNDVFEVMSDGVTAWLWTGTRHSRGVLAFTTVSQTIPTGVETAVSFNQTVDGGTWFDPAFPARLVSIATSTERLRLFGNVIFSANGSGSRRARISRRNRESAEGWPWGTIQAPGNSEVAAINLNGLVYNIGGDPLQLLVVQNSGAPLDLTYACLGIEVLH